MRAEDDGGRSSLPAVVLDRGGKGLQPVSRRGADHRVCGEQIRRRVFPGGGVRKQTCRHAGTGQRFSSTFPVSLL